jgi:hypothetical protein
MSLTFFEQNLLNRQGSAYAELSTLEWVLSGSGYGPNGIPKGIL